MKRLRDCSLIFFRSLQMTARNPVWIFFGLFQPLCFLLLFAPLLEPLSANPEFGGNSLLVFTPGLLIMIALYSTSFVGFGLIDDIRSGVIERFRVTPLSRVAIFLGRSLRDVFILIIQSTFLIIAAWFLGLSATISGVLLAYGIIVLVGFTMSIISYCAAVTLQSEDALAPMLNFFLLPLQLLAGITLPLTLAPAWLQTVANFNPLSHAVYAARALFAGNYSDPSILHGYLFMGTVAFITFYLAARLFKKVAD